MRLLPFILILTFFSCTSVTSYENRQIDKNASFTMTKKFYDALQERDLAKLFPLFNLSQNPVEAEQQQKNLYFSLRATRDKFGDIESYNIISNETKVTEGTTPRTGEYHVVVRVIRKNQKTIFEDKFVMFLVNDKLIINNYDSHPL
jgi:hypothetical protein